MELLNYRKSGERFWNLLSMTPVRDRAGNLMSYIGVQSDITELIRRKEAEQELQARPRLNVANGLCSLRPEQRVHCIGRVRKSLER